MLTREEFNQWREWLQTESSIKPPDFITANYWSWNCRAALARFMMRDKIYEPALRIMETVVEQIPDEDDHYAWALSDLGCLYWRVNHDKEQALLYINKSLEVLDTTEQNRKELSFFSEGGKYLSCKLSILEQAGELKKAREAAFHEIKRYQEKYPDAKYNSYVFYGYLFLAEMEKKSGNLSSAIEFIKHALNASEYAEECQKICSSHRENEDELYSKLATLSQSMIVYFEV